jgi:hypothetical protein
MALLIGAASNQSIATGRRIAIDVLLGSDG